MSNKIKKGGPVHREDLEQICQEMAQNKEQLDTFCSRNHMKFPLITHRSPIFHHVPTSKLMRSLHEEDNPEFRRFQNQLIASQAVGQQFQRKSSICRIVFSKSHNKNPAVSLHSGLMRSTDSKISLINRRHLRKISQDKTSDFKMGQFSTRPTHLQNFINSIDHFKSSKDTLSHSMEMDRSRYPAENRFQLLSINRMSTINPNAELLQTLRGKNLNVLIDRSARETSKRSFISKDLNRISFYKNADGIISPKKPEVTQTAQPSQLIKPKEPPNFQPWQHSSLQQQDYLSQFQK